MKVIAQWEKMQKNVQMRTRLEAVAQRVNAEAKPETVPPSSEAIRAVQQTIPDSDRYAEMNIQDLGRKDVDHLVNERERAAGDVVTYENAGGLPPIEGVYLHFDRGGV